MTIQMKATAPKYYVVVLFIKLYKVVLTFESLSKILSVTIKMKFSLVQFIFGINLSFLAVQGCYAGM